uniref:Serpin family G member 1 n=1 Tax=Anolis carolinensis TaxID=28377 RepID=A0A803SM79_ANOCA
MDVEKIPEPDENSKNSWFSYIKNVYAYVKGAFNKENAGEKSITTDEGKERHPEEEDTAHVNAATNERQEEEKGEKEEIAYVNDTSTEEEVEKPVIASTQADPTTILTTPAATTCPPRSNPWATCTNPTPEDDTKLAEALTEFAVEFYKAAIQNEKRASNFVFSPFSISVMLSNLMLGTCGETTDRLEKLLFYPKGFACVHKALKALSKSEALTSANAIFYQPEFNLDSEFRNLTWEFYQTKMSLLSNNSNQAVLDINAWVSKHTGNKIKKLLEDLEPDAQMVLLNAIYFQAKWKTLFKLKNTKEEEFYRPGLPPIKVPMLTSKKYPVASFFDPYLQAKVGRFQMFHNMSLVIIVPRSLSQSLSEVEERLSADVFKSVMAKLESIHFKPTIVSLPKFKVDSSQDLTEIIGRMDYGFFFDANLCGISPDKDLAISSAQHKAVVQISEEGVEAAAATSVSLARSANFFEVQQPFLFAVSRDGKAPLFLGRITDPQ